MNVEIQIATDERGTGTTRDPHLLKDSDHGEDLIVDSDLLPDGVLEREELLRDGIADHGHTALVLQILGYEISSSGLESQIQGLPEIGSRAERLACRSP